MLAAVVVTYSIDPALLDECIASLRADEVVGHIIVVDTGGAAHPTDPAAEVIRVDNDGYGAAANAGFDRALALDADRILLVNDDLTMRAGWSAPLLAVIDGDIGAAQPMLVTADSDPLTVNSLGVELDEHGAGTDIGDGRRADEVDTHPSEIEMFTGGAVVMTAEFIRATGGFDTRYFLYYEDVDLALRGRELGWRYQLVPAAMAAHRRGATTSIDNGRTRYLRERNRLWVAFRWAPAATITRAVWLSIRRLRHRPRAMHGRALVAGVAGAPGAMYRRVRGPGTRTGRR